MDELEEEERAELAADLRSLLDELHAALELSAEGAKPVDLDQPIGRISRVEALQQQSMARATREGHRSRLDQVKLALSALEEDEYGLCRRCEEPIGFKRLKARPETPLCVACQGRMEGRREG
jgi:DnaK suppressor protein